MADSNVVGLTDSNTHSRDVRWPQVHEARLLDQAVPGIWFLSPSSQNSAIFDDVCRRLMRRAYRRDGADVCAKIARHPDMASHQIL